jgi:hypothetical protein
MGRYTRETGVVTPLEQPPARNPVDLGWICGAHPPMKGGNSWLGLGSSGQEAMVKVYGVVMAMPQGHSRVPNPSTGQQ